MANEEEFRDIHEVPQVVPIAEPLEPIEEEEEEPFMDSEEEPEEDPEEEPEEEAVPEYTANDAEQTDEGDQGVNDLLDEVHEVMQALMAKNQELQERNQQLVEQRQELEERNEELESQKQVKDDRIAELEAYWEAEIEDRAVAEDTKAAVEDELRLKKRKIDRMEHAYRSSYKTFQDRLVNYSTEEYQTRATISRNTAWHISQEEFVDALRRGL